MRTTPSQKIIEALMPNFTRYGYSFSLKSHNAPQFGYEEFEVFLTEHAIADIENAHLSGHKQMGR